MFETQITAQRAEKLRRNFLQGRTSGDAVADERKVTLEMLAAHGRLSSFCALSKGRSSGFGDFMKMRGAMLAGGLRRIRKLSLEPAGAPEYRPSSSPRLPCGCPLDSGCSGYHTCGGGRRS